MTPGSLWKEWKHIYMPNNLHFTTEGVQTTRTSEILNHHLHAAVHRNAAIFELVRGFDHCQQMCNNSYPHIPTNFCRFILIFHQMTLIFFPWVIGTCGTINAIWCNIKINLQKLLGICGYELQTHLQNFMQKRLNRSENIPKVLFKDRV